MNKKKYKVEQVGLLWMLTGENITGAEIFASLSDIPSRFFENLEIIPDTKGGAKWKTLSTTSWQISTEQGANTLMLPIV